MISPISLISQDIILRLHTNPLRLFGLPEQKDTFIEVDVDEQWTIPDHMPYTKSKWTPFSGMRVTGKVKRVVLRNQLVLIDGKVRIRFKADFQSVEFSERAEILLFAGKNVALKMNR